MINLSHYIGAAQQSASVEDSPLHQEKKYLRDFPDHSKTHYPNQALTHIRYSSGYVLVVPDEIKDRLVLEDPSETRLQQLARKYALGLEGAERHALYGQIVAKFGPEETQEAVGLVFEEQSSLYSPERRQWTSDMLEIIKLNGELKQKRAEIQQQWDAVSYTDSDGVRRLNRDVTFWDVCTFVRSELSSCLEKNHRTIANVKVVAAVLFFFYIGDDSHF